jgi:hypothetical protein
LEVVAKIPEPEKQKIPVSLSSDGEDNKKNNKAIYRALRDVFCVREHRR